MPPLLLCLLLIEASMSLVAKAGEVVRGGGDDDGELSPLLLLLLLLLALPLPEEGGMFVGGSCWGPPPPELDRDTLENPRRCLFLVLSVSLPVWSVDLAAPIRCAFEGKNRSEFFSGTTSCYGELTNDWSMGTQSSTLDADQPATCLL